LREREDDPEEAQYEPEKEEVKAEFEEASDDGFPIKPHRFW
jgi:hypothetical protein